MDNYVMNTDGQYGGYIVQTLQTPKFDEEFQKFYATYANRLLWMDSKVVPGAFQMNTSWYMSASDVRPLLKHEEHSHDFDEIIGFLGSDPENPYELGGEIEVGINGELHRLTKSSIIFLPAGIKHLPLSLLRVDRPILHFSVCMSPVYANTRTNEGAGWLADGSREP